MTWLNGLLAFGALAFTIPLAIHLLFRSRFRTLDWGAMHLLDSVVRINRRRIELMNLLLLLLRCAIPILLAFCLARPVLTGFRTLPGEQPQTVVVVVDDSRSMAARGVGANDDAGVASGLPRVDRAKQAVAQLLGSLSRRDEVILMKTSQIDAAPGLMGSRDAAKQLRTVTADSGPVDLSRIVRAAVAASETGSHPDRRILVVSDFQSETVSEAAIESLGRLGTSLGQQPIQPSIAFLNLGGDSENLSNVSVDSIESESPAVVAGRTGKFSARLRNASDTPASELRLTWSIDGKPMVPQTISIGPRASATAVLTHTIDRPGVHIVGVAIEHSDALIEDNQRLVAIEAIDPIGVTLVDGKPSREPLDGETDFLAIALSPFAFGGQDQPDAVRTEVISRNSLDKLFQASRRPEIIVLANVRSINEKSQAELARFVFDGGSLVIFDGDQVQPETYNRPWTDGEVTIDLPARLGSPVGKWQDGETAMAVGPMNRQYSAWEVLGGRDDASDPFGEVDVFGYRKLDATPAPAPESGDVRFGEMEFGEMESGEMEYVNAEATTRLLSMQSGDPLVVTARRGRGRIVQFAIACDADASSLPLRTVFLPMMQQLVLDLAGSRKTTTVMVGQSVGVPVQELASRSNADGDSKANEKNKEEGSAAEDAEAVYTLVRPDGTEISLQRSGDETDTLLIAQTPTSGVYRVGRSRVDASWAGEGVDGDAVDGPRYQWTSRVAQVPASESRLRDVQPERLTLAAESIDATVYTELEAAQSDDQTRRFGREVWRWLLLALLIGMIGELLLQQRTGGKPAMAGGAA